MKALLLQRYGQSQSSLKLEDTIEPIPKDSQLLVKVKAAALNPVDYKMINGNYKIVQRFNFPQCIGYDFSGEVVQVGNDVKRFKLGDKVFGCLSADKMGSFAEFCLADEESCCLSPENSSMIESASFPLAGMTVLQSLDKAKLKKGDRILIHAGSGGVGSLAIQYAKHLGVEVFTTTSSKNVEWVKAFGADRVIAYDQEDYQVICKDLDVVFDTLGGKYSEEAISVLKSGGSLVNIAGGIDHKAAKDLGVPAIFCFLLYLKRLPLSRKLKKKNISYNYVLMKTNAVDLQRLKILVESEKMKAVIDKVYAMQEYKEAFALLESGRAKGKIVFDIS
jgi:NADPH:quinone reductase-like Zn-dependent oxidoreductase